MHVNSHIDVPGMSVADILSNIFLCIQHNKDIYTELKHITIYIFVRSFPLTLTMLRFKSTLGSVPAVYHSK